MLSTKIDKHTILRMSKTHVVPQLAKVCIGRMADGFELYNHSVNHQVHTVSLIQANIVPKYGQLFLPLYYMAAFLQQVFHCCLISGFQQTGTEFCMYFHCNARDDPHRFQRSVMFFYYIHGELNLRKR